MHCLVVTIFYCVDIHFKSIVAILLLLTMVYVQKLGKIACYVYRIGYIGIGFFLNNEYRISKNRKI